MVYANLCFLQGMASEIYQSGNRFFIDGVIYEVRGIGRVEGVIDVIKWDDQGQEVFVVEYADEPSIDHSVLHPREYQPIPQDKLDAPVIILGVEEPPSAEEQIAALKSELAEIDLKSIRGERSALIAVGSGAEPDAVDIEKLKELEAQAAAVRGQIQELENPQEIE